MQFQQHCHLQDAEALLTGAIQAEHNKSEVESQLTAAIAVAIVDFGLKLSSSKCHFVIERVPVKQAGAAIVHLKRRLALGSKSLASIVFELHLETYFSIVVDATAKQITLRPAALLPDASDAVKRLLPGVAWSNTASGDDTQAERVTETASCKISGSSEQVIMHNAIESTNLQQSPLAQSNGRMDKFAPPQPYGTNECSTCTEYACVCGTVQLEVSQANQASAFQ